MKEKEEIYDIEGFSSLSLPSLPISRDEKYKNSERASRE